jgi:hypothetical protein
MRERGDMTMSQIARALDIGRTTLYDHLDLYLLWTASRARTPTTSSPPERAAGSAGVCGAQPAS